MALEVRGLAKAYGGVQALRGIDFSVQPGECVALIGPNGAGKSTSFGCIAGQIAPDAGTVLWRGEDLMTWNPAQRLARGIARTFQVAQVFDALCVRDNLALVLAPAAGHGLRWSPWRRLAADAARVAKLLHYVGLQARADAIAGTLAYGERKRLELAIALAGVVGQTQRPCLLLLDEPAAGLAAAERAALMSTVRALADGAGADLGLQRMAILYTEHNMDAVFGVADRVVVLIEGQILAEGSPTAIAGDARVRARYLGHGMVSMAGGADAGSH